MYRPRTTNPRAANQIASAQPILDHGKRQAKATSAILLGFQVPAPMEMVNSDSRLAALANNVSLSSSVTRSPCRLPSPNQIVPRFVKMRNAHAKPSPATCQTPSTTGPSPRAVASGQVKNLTIATRRNIAGEGQEFPLACMRMCHRHFASHVLPPLGLIRMS